MTISVLTLFPDIFPPVFSSSIIGRAQKKGLASVTFYDIRAWATDKHKSVDDKPFGGGVGMVMRVDIIAAAIAATRKKDVQKNRERVILLDPKGEQWSQARASSFTALEHLILVCGHYEGVDQRIEHFIDDAISIGPYVLTGGEIPAMVLVDSIVRLLPGVLAKPEATQKESFSDPAVLEWPQYTRPAEYQGHKVPDILLGGNHKQIDAWRQRKLKKVHP